MFIEGSNLPQDSRMLGFATQRLHGALKVMDDRLKDNKWLAGDEFTAADTMSVYSVTTQRYFGPQVSLKEYPNIVRWLKDCAERPAYQKAMEKGDPEMVSCDRGIFYWRKPHANELTETIADSRSSGDKHIGGRRSRKRYLEEVKRRTIYRSRLTLCNLADVSTNTNGYPKSRRSQFSVACDAVSLPP